MFWNKKISKAKIINSQVDKTSLVANFAYVKA